MDIDSGYQGQKIGTKLIDDFKNYLKSNNISNIKVIASSKNLNAIKFYQHLNFKIIRKIKKYYNNEDAFFMVKEINE